MSSLSMRRGARRWRRRHGTGPIWLWHGLAVLGAFGAVWATLDYLTEGKGLDLRELSVIVTAAVNVGFGSWLRGVWEARHG